MILMVRHGRTPTTGKVLPGRAKGLHLFGGVDARLGKGGLGRGAEIADGRDGRAHA